MSDAFNSVAGNSSVEGKWFASWVVMRRKFKKKEEDNAGLVKDNIALFKRIEKLEFELTKTKQDVVDAKRLALKMRKRIEINTKEE